MKLDSLTSPEIKDYLKTNQALIIPVGTCEQHGSHLPLNTDTLTVEKVADKVSEKTGILVAPTITYGVNFICDQKRWGTTSVTESGLKNFLKSIIEW